MVFGAVLSIVVAIGVLAAGPPIAAPPGYVLIDALSDEFEGAQLDHTKWTTDKHYLGWPGSLCVSVNCDDPLARHRSDQTCSPTYAEKVVCLSPSCQCQHQSMLNLGRPVHRPSHAMWTAIRPSKFPHRQRVTGLAWDRPCAGVVRPRQRGGAEWVPAAMGKGSETQQHLAGRLRQLHDVRGAVAGQRQGGLL